MSHKVISHNQDLQRLRNEGFDIEIKQTYLLVHHIPFVNSKKEIAYGVLVSTLELAGLNTSKPTDHTVYFIGEHPCDINGNILLGIQNSSQKIKLIEGLDVDHKFSNKPTGGYSDYYHKMFTYYRIISSQAEAIDSSAIAKTHNVRKVDDPEFPFNYPDTNSARAEILAISEKLSQLRVAILGLGGAGAYILDFIAKTPVKEIHIYDGDDFLSHNAFRSPGSVSIEELNQKQKKITYFYGLYAKLHKYIIPHEYYVTEVVVEELFDFDFVFISIDDGQAKKMIIEKLKEHGVPFIDVGMGVNEIGGMLTGSARTTTVTKEKNDHINLRISFFDKHDDVYDQNIQISELNALNAALAVIKWKKMFGFYHDLKKEHNSTYNINVNSIIND